MKIKIDSNAVMAWSMMCLVFLVPMLISTKPSPEPRQYAIVVDPSEKPLVADRMEENGSELEEFSLTEDFSHLGKGGPLEELLYPTEEATLKAAPKTKSVLKVNKLNYSNAIFPVAPADVSSDFGWRTPPCDGCSADHNGVDFVPGYGEPIVAILDGLVVEAGVFGGYGTWVKIEHRVPSVENEGEFEIWETIYAHMQTGSIPESIGVGSVVSKGDLLGLVGNTGQSTGAHLHFEILIDGVPEDPIPLLATYQRITIMPDGEERFARYE